MENRRSPIPSNSHDLGKRLIQYGQLGGTVVVLPATRIKPRVTDFSDELTGAYNPRNIF